MDRWERNIAICSSWAILITLSLSGTILWAQGAELPEHIDNHGPFHLSWRSEKTRSDLIFSPKNITAPISDLESLVASNSSTIARCQGRKGCLFTDGKLLRTYETSTFGKESFIFTSISQKDSSDVCKGKYSIKIDNYCSTHWNPPIHITGSECRHTVDWHSPYSCTANQTNYAIPCYVHDPSGKLIDLSHLILSNGSSYEIDTGNFNETIKQFHLNVCNEASEPCGPNASSCRSGANNLLETGYNNLTSIKYDSKEELVRLVSLGEFNDKCTDKRVKTVVKFRCPKQYGDKSKPKLINADDCENIVDWPTIRACPVPDVQAPATNCSIKYEPLGIDIDLKKIFLNQTSVEVADINLGGKSKTMILGLCQGINPSVYRCAGKSTKSTSACLLDGGERKPGVPKYSEIVGSNSKSVTKLADSHLLLESFANNKTCEVPVTRDFNYTRPIGTRIEVVCAEKDDVKPKFIKFEDCVYVFEWGSSQLCLENMVGQAQKVEPSVGTSPKPAITPSPSTSPVPTTNHTENHKNSDLDDTTNKTAQDMHKDTVADAKNIMKPAESPSTSAPKPQVTEPEPKKDLNNGQSQQPNGKMNKTHKFFMIGLIVMSLTAFVVVIFILDSKTHFKIPLGRIGRRARQALRPQPVPYTRVNFNDHLDL